MNCWVVDIYVTASDEIYGDLSALPLIYSHLHLYAYWLLSSSDFIQPSISVKPSKVQHNNASIILLATSKSIQIVNRSNAPLT